MRALIFGILCLSSLVGIAQVACDNSVAPQSLSAVYSSGFGVKLSWDPVIGSQGVQLLATSPVGSSISRRIVGVELDGFNIADALLGPGVYTWTVQATCSNTPPFDLTPVAPLDTFSTIISLCSDSVVDYDGNVYSVVQVGFDCWMGENLRTSQYGNGDAIPSGLSDSLWQEADAGAVAFYDNDPALGLERGYLYNWHATSDSRQLCPIGWRIPSLSDWNGLAATYGGKSVAGGALKATGTIGLGTGIWMDPNLGATNSSGFTGLPNGVRTSSGSFISLNLVATWWTSEGVGTRRANSRIVQFDSTILNLAVGSRNNGNAVRCVKD